MDETTDSAGACPRANVWKIARIFLWAALIYVGGRATIPIPVVLITLQTFFIILAGLVEGPLFGALAAGTYVVAGLLGAPVFSGGVGGLTIFSRASAGFILAFPLCGALAGLAAGSCTKKYSLSKGIIIAIVAHAMILVLGCIGMMVFGKLPLAKAIAALPGLLPGAVVKSILAALAAALPWLRRMGETSR